MVKVWLIVFLVQFPGTRAQLPVFKTVATEDECQMHIIETWEVARAEGITIRGSCTEYDGLDEEQTAMGIALTMAIKGEKH